MRGVHKGNAYRCTWAKARKVVGVPDADYRTKPEVRAGAESTARFLADAGATEVLIAAAPGIGGRREGIDGVLARDRDPAERLNQLIESAEPVDGPGYGELFISGTDFLADAMIPVPALWGAGDVTLWAQGESLMLVGPPCPYWRARELATREVVGADPIVFGLRVWRPL